MNVISDILFSERFSAYRNIAAVIGAAYVLRVTVHHLWAFLKAFFAYVIAPYGVMNIDLKKYGSWAVVTGASEGIGRGYALELARRGLNVAIISRSEEKLQKVEDEIKSKYDRDVRVISADFSKGQDVYAIVQSEISDLDVAVLVNNVGLSLVHPEFFGEVDETRHRDMIELNCQSMVQMTHLVLPKMIEKSKGIIVNLSSIGACQPTPLLNIYSASKEFVRYFSISLQTEYQSKGIIVQCVSPGPVATAMTGIKRPKWWAPDPITYTRSAVSTIGIQQHTYGYIPHAIQGYISKDVMPEWLYLITSFNGMKAAKENFLKRKSKRQ